MSKIGDNKMDIKMSRLRPGPGFKQGGEELSGAEMEMTGIVSLMIWTGK